MILNIDQKDYVKEMGDVAGIRIVVMSQNQMPLPEEQGLTVGPGHYTSIGVKQVVIDVLLLRYTPIGVKQVGLLVPYNRLWFY